MKQPSLVHYLYGYYPVLEAIKAGKRKFYCLFLDEKIKQTPKAQEFCQLAKQKNITIQYKSSLELEKICFHKQHQHLVLKAGELPYSPLQTLLDNRKKKNIWVGLDHLHDPQNVGAILRTCLYFQIENIFITKQQTCPLSNSVSKTSVGAMESLNFCSPMNFSLLIKKLKKENFWIVGAALDGDNFATQSLPDNCFLILGNEHKGIQPLLKKSCDFLWKIEGGGTNSLNVSASSAILLHYIYNYQA